MFRWHFPRDGLFYDDAWQAFGAVEGGFRQLFTVGQTQPGFGLELMVWSRVFGSSASASDRTRCRLPDPRASAGLVSHVAQVQLRGLDLFSAGVALTVCETAITYSGHVESYTSDVLVILLLCVLLPWLARQRWTLAIAVAWFGARWSSPRTVRSPGRQASPPPRFSCSTHRAIARFASSLAALRRSRSLVRSLAEDRTHSAAKLEFFFKSSESYIQIHLNPVTFAGSEMVKHLVRVTDIFPAVPVG